MTETGLAVVSSDWWGIVEIEKNNIVRPGKKKSPPKKKQKKSQTVIFFGLPSAWIIECIRCGIGWIRFWNVTGFISIQWCINFSPRSCTDDGRVWPLCKLSPAHPQKNVNGVKVCPLWWPIDKWKWRLTLPEPLVHRCKMPVETVPQWTCAVIKAKGGPMKHLFRPRPFMLIMPVYCCWCTYTFWCSCFLHKQNLRTWLLYWQRSHDILWILHKQKKVKSVNFRDSSWDTLES